MKLYEFLSMMVAIALLASVLLLGMARNRALDDGAPSLLRRGAAGLWAFLVRWQEHAGWAPLCAAAALFAWIILGALDRTAAIDLLAPLGMAPVRAVYAFLALGATLLAVKRGRRKLNDEEQAAFWQRLIGGTWRDGAVIIYLTERVFALVVLALFLHHFRIAA